MRAAACQRVDQRQKREALADACAMQPCEWAIGARNSGAPHALGEARNVWPGWVTIRNFAYRLQTPPDPENPIKQSWLHSRLGPQLRERGELVETYLFLDEKGRPPTKYEERQIAEKARENAQQRRRIVAAIERGTASEDDRRWVAGYDQYADLCNDIVDAGIAHRHGDGEAA